MKIAIECNSILLKKTLLLFLQPFVVPLKQCDFVIVDYDANLQKPTFFIGTPRAHILKPFTKEMLYASIKEFYVITCKKSDPEKTRIIKHSTIDAKLKKDVEKLTHNFTKELLELVQKYYEKQ